MTSNAGLASRFSLGETLGSGGMCVVHFAKDHASGRDVAIKLLRPETRNTESEQSLRHEYLLLARLKHPALIELIDFGFDEKVGPYLVLEFFRGRIAFGLRAYLSESSCISVVAQLCRVINFLHARGFVHGDLKPENILVQSDWSSCGTPPHASASPRLKLLDLGFASQIQRGSPLPLRGTPGYAPPELLSGAPADHRADLYALGRVIVDIFRQATSNAIQDPHRDPHITASLIYDLPPFLSDIVRSLLDPDPSRRPPTAVDVLEQLSATHRSTIELETREGTTAALESCRFIGHNTAQLQILASCEALLHPTVPTSTSLPSVFLIHGEPGIGKSRLLLEIHRELSSRNLPHLHFPCSERPADPLGPFRSILQTSTPNPLDTPTPLATGQALPNVTESGTSSWDTFRHHKALAVHADALASALSKPPRVLLLDDVHLLDEDSFEVFLGLIARADQARYLVIATFRTEGFLARRLQRLLEDHLALPHIKPLVLSRLTRSETEDVLSDCFGPHRDLSSLAAAAYGASGGNPLFLFEYVRTLMDAGHISGGPFRWMFDPHAIGAPEEGLSLRELARQRLGTHTGDEISLLEYLSVYEEPAGVALLHEASGRPYPELRRILSALVAKGLVLLQRQDAADAYGFAHEVYRAAVLEDLPPARRQELHRFLGVALERLSGCPDDASVGKIAYHFLRAKDSAKGPVYALSAADLARARGAAQRAISLYNDALNLLPSDQLDLRYEILQKLANLLRQSGDLPRAQDFYLEMLLAARRRGDTPREALALSHLARIDADRGDISRATSYAERALQMHQALGDPAGSAQALLTLAIAIQKSGQNKRACDLALTSRALAHTVGDKLLYGLAANCAGISFAHLRRYDEALSLFIEWLAVAEETNDILAKSVALSNIGWMHLERGCLKDAQQYFDRCLQIRSELGLAYWSTAPLLNAGEVARLTGNLPQSRQRLQEALAASERVERNEFIQYAIYSLGILDMMVGHYAEAEASLHRALEMATDMGAQLATAMTLVVVGDLRQELGQADAAFTAYLRAAALAEELSDEVTECAALSGILETLYQIGTLEDSSLIELLALLPEGVFAAKDSGADPGEIASDRALKCLGASKEGAESSSAVPSAWTRIAGLAEKICCSAQHAGSAQMIVRSELACALMHLSVGQPDLSSSHAFRAVRLARDRGLRPYLARALVTASLAQARGWDVSEAETMLSESLVLAEEIGLPVVCAQVVGELASLASARGDLERSRNLVSRAAVLLEELARALPDSAERLAFMSVGWRKSIMERAEQAKRRGMESWVRSTNTVPGSDQIPSPTQTHAGVAVPAAPAGIDDPARSCDAVSAGSERETTHLPSAGSGGASQAPAVNSPRDLRSAVTSLLEEALRSTASDRGLVFLIAPDRSSEIVVARGLESESIRDARSYCRGVIDQAAHGEEILVVDTSRDERFRDRRSVSLFHIVSIICIPLRIGPRVMGALYLDSRAGGRLLREEDFRAARGVAARMASRIREAWERERRREEALLKQRALCQAYRLDAIIGESPAMKKVFRVLEAVIASDCNVLIVGDSGTGKELAARAIHFSGRRKMAPFVPLDCGALQDALVESELFGYRRGAFTGADADKRGLFEEADGGTIFLDEITNTSMLFQAKLLRVLQAGEFRRIGDTTARRVDVRIVAATNADLEMAVREGRFREDLFYRLNVVAVEMPPLRERPEDIPILSEQFARTFCEREKIPYRGIGESALTRLRTHSWPGNVRELKNAIESALVLSRDGAVRREFLPENLRGGSFEEIRDLLKDGTVSLSGAPPEAGSRAAHSGEGAPPQVPPATTAHAEAPGGVRPPSAHPEGWLTEPERRALQAAEEADRIRDALVRAGGDKSLAAGMLGWSRMTLYRKMRRLGIDYATGRPEAG